MWAFLIFNLPRKIPSSSSSFNKCIPLSRVLPHWKLYTCGQVSNFPFTIKNKEVEIMEGWCLSGYDGRCQWSLSWQGSVVGCSSRIGDRLVWTVRSNDVTHWATWALPWNITWTSCYYQEKKHSNRMENKHFSIPSK